MSDDDFDLMADTETVDLSRDPVEVKIGAATDIGLRRERNEDHFVVVRRTRSRSVVATNLPE